MHYSPSFKAALDKVLDTAEKHGELAARHEFRNQMLKLGHEERVKNLYRIKDKMTQKAIFFQPNGPQLDFLRRKSHRNIILKCRQVGMTALNCVRALDLALWTPNITTGIMAHNKDKIREIFDDKTKFTYEWFDRDWGHMYKPKKKFDSKNELSFSDDGLGNKLGSKIIVTFDARGSSMFFLHVSEAAFVDSKRLRGSIEGVPDSGEVTYESTANGMAGVFYDTWQNYKLKRSFTFKGFFVPWFTHYPDADQDVVVPDDFVMTEFEEELVKRHPEITKRHLAWRRYKIIDNYGGDSDAFEVEYPTDDVTCFDAGVGKVFPSSIIAMQRKTIREPRKVGYICGNKILQNNKGDITIWEEPVKGRRYVIGADPAGGVGKDYTAAYVMDLTSRRIVAKIYGFIVPKDFATELAFMGRYYNNANICIEENNHGAAVIDQLRNEKYVHLYKRRTLDEFTAKPTQKIGFRTTPQTKLPLTEQLKNALQDGDLIAVDANLVAELTTFIQISGKSGYIKREATAGGHDDLVMAAAFAVEAAKYYDRAITETNSIMEMGIQYDPDTGFPL